MKFVELHVRSYNEEDDKFTKSVWYNISNIVGIEGDSDGSYIFTSDGYNRIVIETPEEVLNLIHKVNG